MQLAATMARADVEINETNFPDEAFRSWLLEQDYGKDGMITDKEIAEVTSINVREKGIESLKGIEFFTALHSLYCFSNHLTMLDVSKNTALEELTCSDNPLTTLDVSKNTALTWLECSADQLTELDVSKNTDLVMLGCEENQLTTLDLSKNTALIYLFCNNNNLMTLDVSQNIELAWILCYQNQLTGLNVSGCTWLEHLDCYGNQMTELNVSGCKKLQKLICYQNQIKDEEMDALVESLPTVTDGEMCVIYDQNEQNVMYTTQVSAAKTKGWIPKYYDRDSWNWKEYEGSAPPSPPMPVGVEINELNFPDEYFRNYLLNRYDGADGILTDDEIAAITYIDISSPNIQSLKGIEYFTSLTYLVLNSTELKTLDLSKNTALINLRCTSNKQLKKLDLLGCTELKRLDCYYNKLTTLDLSKNTNLESLDCSNNQLSTLNISSCTALKTLSCGDNQLTTLNVSNCTALTNLACYLNKLTALDISKNNALTSLNCIYNQLKSLDLSQNTALGILYCEDNQLSVLDVSQNTLLKELKCSNNQLLALDLSKNDSLTVLECYRNQIKEEAMGALVESLPIVSESGLYVIYNEEYLGIYGSNDSNEMTKVQVAAAKAKGWIPYYWDGYGWSEYAGSGDDIPLPPATGIAINETNFPDEKFRGWVLSQGFGTDGVLTDEEIARVKSITVVDKKIQSLKGIEFFTALEELDCMYNKLTELDISKNSALIILRCINNKLTKLDVSKNTALKTLDCELNYLTELDVSQNEGLYSLVCSMNLLKELDLSNNAKLEGLSISKNQIKGEAMDRLVKSLPDRSFSYDYGGAYNGTIDAIYWENEQNVMTKMQVAAAKAKGWTPYYRSIDPEEGEISLEYEGSGEAIETVIINEENFPSENFRKWLLNQWFGTDGVLMDVEIAHITKIVVHDWNIQSLKGIEFFTELTYLDCESNHLTALDVSKNSKLEYLNCNTNPLNVIDVSQNTLLTELQCQWDQLSVLDISKNTSLITLNCSKNNLNSLEISGNTALKELYCDNNYLRTLDVSKNTALTLLSCPKNQLTTLDVANNTELNDIICYNNKIKNELMDALIKSLPTVSQGMLKIIHKDNEGNVITVEQVAAAKAKGWIPAYWDGNWQEYDGDPDDIKSPFAEAKEESIYNQAGQRLSKVQRGLNIIGGKKVIVK